MNTSEQVTEIFKALVKAQGETKNATKDAENPYFGSKYADLSSIIEATKKPLSDNGLAVIQSPSTEQGSVTITTRIIHISGQWIESSLTFVVQKSDPQSIGSAITYGRRYTWAAMLGITQEDDDGNGGSDQKPDPKGNQNRTGNQTKPGAGKPPLNTGNPGAGKPKEKGKIEGALAAINGAKDIAALDKVKEQLERRAWTAQEEIQIDDAFKTKLQLLEGK